MKIGFKNQLFSMLLRINLKHYGMIIVLIFIWLIFLILTNYVYFTPRNLSNLFVQSTTVAILSIGMTLVIIAGHIDLSVGSVLGFCGAISAVLMIRFNMDVISAILITLCVGALIGLWHGYWIAYKNVPSFVVSLSSMIVFRGAIIGVTGGKTQGLEMAPVSTAVVFRAIGQNYLPKLNKSLPFHDTTLYLFLFLIFSFWVFDLLKRKRMQNFGFKVSPLSFYILKNTLITLCIGLIFLVMILYMGIPYCVLIVIGLLLIFSFITANTTFGRHLYAIGGDLEAAKLSGINIRRELLVLFTLMGIMSAVAGIVYTSRLNAATTSAGVNSELDAIAAATIGGASLMGGEGTVLGAVIGALIMTSLDNGMSLMNLDVTFQYIIKGIVLLLVVCFDISTKKRHKTP